MPHKLFVGGLPWATTSEDLEKLFCPFGGVASAKVIADRKTGRSKGYGFVEMENSDGATQAQQRLNESELNGRKITVDAAKVQEEETEEEEKQQPNLQQGQESPEELA